MIFKEVLFKAMSQYCHDTNDIYRVENPKGHLLIKDSRDNQRVFDVEYDDSDRITFVWSCSGETHLIYKAVMSIVWDLYMEM